MNFDLAQVDLDAQGLMADWPDTLTYDQDVSTLITCIVEDLNSALVLTDDTYIPGTDLRVGVRVAAVGGNTTFFQPQKTLQVRGKLWRIIHVFMSSDEVMYTLSLMDAAKL